jgi:hypothetical protein
VGPYHPLGSSPIQRRGEISVIAGVVVVDLKAIKQNLEGLTINVLDATIYDIPRHYQRHTVGVSASIGRLLRRVPREFVCYSEQHLLCFLYMKPCASHF